MTGTPRELELEQAERIRSALSTVVDPELGIDIVALGLVYEVDVVGSRARVTYTLTSMGCPAGSLIAQAIEEAALQVEGVERVDQELVFDPPWSPDRMDEDTKFVLGL
jgi:metal-sulfur cluster biosynthetic enzyme